MLINPLKQQKSFGNPRCSYVYEAAYRRPMHSPSSYFMALYKFDFNFNFRVLSSHRSYNEF